MPASAAPYHKKMLLHLRLTNAKYTPSAINSAFKGMEVKIFRCPATVMGLRQRTGNTSHCSALLEWEGA
jgi:hypothetical protein